MSAWSKVDIGGSHLHWRGVTALRYTRSMASTSIPRPCRAPRPTAPHPNGHSRRHHPAPARRQTPTLDRSRPRGSLTPHDLLHFPTLDQLILDASTRALAGSDIEAEFEAVTTEAAERVATIVDTLYDHAEEWLPLGRRMVALTATYSLVDGPKPGQRRVDWIERAVESSYANSSPTSSTTASCHRSPSSWDGRQRTYSKTFADIPPSASAKSPLGLRKSLVHAILEEASA